MLKRVLIGLAVFLLGFGLGVYFAYRVIVWPRMWMGAVGNHFMAGQYFTTQYFEAAYPDAVRALEAWLAFLDSERPARERWAPGDQPWLDRRGVSFEEALTYARLAILHERAGNFAASEKAWARA